MGSLVACGVLAGCGGPSLAGVQSTVTYCTSGGVAETMDLYEPSPAPTTSVPAVVYVHGGGWVAGSARLTPGTLSGDTEAALVGRGWVFASIDYRLAPEAPWPAQIEDAKCAVRYLRANASRFHVDPGHIGTIGDSAGGQLVAMLGLAGPTAGFDVGQYAGESSAVQAVVDAYGPTDIGRWTGTVAGMHLTAELFGGSLPDSSGLASASPVDHVSGGAPPFLIVQGAEDEVVPPDQSRELARRLHRAGDPVTLLMVRGAGHGLLPAGDRAIDPSIDTITDRVVAFFEAALGSS